MSPAQAAVIDSLDTAEVARKGAFGLLALYLQDRAGKLKEPVRLAVGSVGSVNIVSVLREAPSDSAYPVSLKEDDDDNGFEWAIEEFDVTALREFVLKAEFTS